MEEVKKGEGKTRKKKRKEKGEKERSFTFSVTSSLSCSHIRDFSLPDHNFGSGWDLSTHQNLFEEFETFVTKR